jgi:hypothetical protein
MFAGLQRLAGRILAIALRSQPEVERDLWMNWLARLDHSQDDLINTLPIRRKAHAMGFDHLAKPLELETPDKGLNQGWEILRGDVDDDEQREVVAAAQLRWLERNRPGITLPVSAIAIDSRFRGEQHVEAMRPAVIGRTGVIRTGDEISPPTSAGDRYVRVGGHDLYIGPRWTGRSAGDHVVVTGVAIKPHIANGVNAEWDDSMLEASVEDARQLA